MLLCRRKISKKNAGKTWKMKSDGKQRISEGLSEKWKDPTFKKQQSKAISEGILNSAKRDNRKPRFRLTNMHKRMRLQMSLDELGFISEQCVSHCWADELNEKAKIIVEFNGDYVHANPRFYAADQVIKLRGQSYTAAEKWEADACRQKRLEDAGYAVLVVWESDDLVEARSCLQKLLSSRSAYLSV